MTSDRVTSIALTILIITSAAISVGMIPSVEGASAASDTIVVDKSGSGDASSIQKGINMASAGDTVLVNKGTYNETVVVNESVRVVANGSVVLDGGSRVGTAFTVNNSSGSLSNVVIKGFEITNYSSSGPFTGHGITVTEPTLSNITLQENAIHDFARHGIIVFNDGGNQQDIKILNNSIEDVQLVGLALINLGGTQDDISVKNTSVRNASSSGLGLRVRGSGTTTNVSVENVSLSESGNAGIYINLTETGTLDDLRFRRMLVNKTGGPGLFLDVNPNATTNTISLRESVFQNNTGGGLVVSPSTPAGDLKIHRSIIRDNGNGVNNQNASGLVDARYNFWGSSTGPGSDASSALKDPVTGRLADGSGDNVSESATSGVANVQFSPAICGKTTTDSQLIKPDFNQTFTLTIAGDTFTLNASDCVGLWVWERAIFPFRASSDDAANRIQLPTVVLNTSEGDVSINRRYLSVYQAGEPVTLNLTRLDKAETDRFAGEEVQVVFVKVDEGIDTNQTLDEFFNSSIDPVTGNVTAGVDGVTVLKTEDVGTVSNLGEVQTTFTPPESGNYLAVLVTKETGDGFEATNGGNLTFNVLNDTSSIIGVEVIFAQQTSSSVTANRTEVVQGNPVSFEAQSNLSASEVTHLLVAYNKTEFEQQLIEVKTTDIVNVTETGILVSINGTSDGEPFFIRANLSDNGTIRSFETGGSLSDVDSNSTFVTNGNATETITMELGRVGNLPSGTNTTYQFVHLAFNESDPSIRSTDTGTITVAGPSIQVVNASVSPTNIQRGQSVTVRANLTNPGTSSANGTVRVRVNGTEAANQTVTLGAGETREVNFSIKFTVAGSFLITVDEVEAGIVTVQAPTQPPSDGGGGGGGGGQEPAVSWRVVNTESGQSIIVRDAQTGSVFDVPLNVGGAGVTITNLRIDQRFQDPKYTVQIRRPRANPRSGTKALDVGQGIAYFQITRLDIKNVNIRSVTFTFTIDSAALPEGASPENVRLFRFNRGKWQELETTHLGGNRYRAVSPGFSAFAVGVVSPAEETPTETETPTTPTETPTTPTETPATPPETPTTPPETPGGFFQTLLLGLLVGFLLIALILIGGYYAYREGYLDEYVRPR